MVPGPSKNAFERVPGGDRPSEPAPRRVVAIAAHKGGVGKTTTAINLAAALARGGASVVLVDLDPQGHSTMGLGIEPDTGRTVRELLVRDALPLGACTYPTKVTGLSLVPSTIRLEATAQELYGRAMRHAVLADALEPAEVEWVVLDCPPSLGPLVEGALYAATHVIVPCRMEARATDGLRDLVDVLRLVRGRTFDEWRVLRTVVDVRNRVSNMAVEAQLAEGYSGWLLSTVIPKCEDLNKAQIVGADIFDFASGSRGADAYGELAGEVQAWPSIPAQT